MGMLQDVKIKVVELIKIYNFGSGHFLQTHSMHAEHTYIQIHTPCIKLEQLACNKFPLGTFSFPWQYVFGQVLFHDTDLLRKVSE